MYATSARMLMKQFQIHNNSKYIVVRNSCNTAARSILIISVIARFRTCFPRRRLMYHLSEIMFRFKFKCENFRQKINQQTCAVYWCMLMSLTINVPKKLTPSVCHYDLKAAIESISPTLAKIPHAEQHKT